MRCVEVGADMSRASLTTGIGKKTSTRLDVNVWNDLLFCSVASLIHILERLIVSERTSLSTVY